MKRARIDDEEARAAAENAACPKRARRERLLVLGVIQHDPRELQRRYTPQTNVRNAHARDARIRFDGSLDPATGQRRHDYYVDGSRDGLSSVTRCCEHFWPGFDRDAISARVAANAHSGQYAGKTAEEIRAMWQRTSEEGTAKHAQYEEFLQQTGTEDVNPYSAPPGFYRALAAHPEWDVYRCEWTVFDEDARIVGSIDAVMRNRDTGAIVLVDWKNLGEGTVHTNPYKKTGTHPLTRRHPATKHLKHTMQLNFYRHLLETRYGLVVESMYIFNFAPTAPDAYEEYRLERWDMAPFFALFPWRADDPRHLLPPAPGQNVPPPLFPPLTPEERRHLEDGQRSTRTARIQAGPLPDMVVWMGYAYKKGAYALEQSEWVPPGKRVWPRLSADDLLGYEAALLADRVRLEHAHRQLSGKTLLCWCGRPGEACHAEVLALYVSALDAGVRRLPPGVVESSDDASEEEEEKEEEEEQPANPTPPTSPFLPADS